jgi:hypothetical protein
MSHPIIKTTIRFLLVLTTHKRAKKQEQHMLLNYLKLSEGLTKEMGSQSVEVPPMTGVDEDMRRWSFYMILEHNEIVNRSISAIVEQLSRGEPLSGAATIDPKEGVMPSPYAGEEQILKFKDSVNYHLKLLDSLGNLRGTATAPHMIFGDFDAHKWNCMFSFHLKVHHSQAKYVIQTVKAKK